MVWHKDGQRKREMRINDTALTYIYFQACKINVVQLILAVPSSGKVVMMHVRCICILIARAAFEHVLSGEAKHVHFNESGHQV